ncbi:hypothetical protein [Rhizobium sp. NFR12]|uniref:hypothetical protein n=1 Tax=Rhizobium sp. NFR12 TaxID=1566261 RepID=UPI0008A75709|nr:hypothetical protein [Rhizobium sp. NFR12]SEH22537.1 hypothetical protein SAMN03159407_1178 [Rhizobium sp. NFR12]
MSYRRSYILQAVIGIIAFLRASQIYSVVCNVARHVVWAFTAPVVYLVEKTPVPAVLTMLFSKFKPVMFRVIAFLKPVYRESHDTHGLSLPSVRD